MGKVLIVDDEGKMRALLAMALDAEGHAINEAQSGEAALSIMETWFPDVVITDVRMSGISGVELVRTIKSSHPDVECIVMTAYADAKSGIEAMRGGALEYVAKPFEMDEMLLLVKNALEKNRLGKEVDALKSAAVDRFRLENIVGSSKALQETIRLARSVAQHDTTVLIRGRSGTGKELFARGIHALSGRKKFLAVNCGALPHSLLESELFGHEKGSFTGAHERKLGLFERAGDGTIFLDEIGEISPELQVKLLRVLQEREFTRIGGSETLHSSARVITATNRDLEDAVKEGMFREDLYYRLNVFPLTVPSLTDRIDDIPALVDTFLLKFHHSAGIAEGVISALMEYAWPGNIRELENCIERSVIMADTTPITPDHLPEHIRNRQVLQAPGLFKLPPEGISLDELEKSCILQALALADDNKTRAAELLGISRRAIYSRMKTHRIGDLHDE